MGFEGPVDSVYLGAKDYVELDVGTGAAVAIASSGWEDVVVVCPSLAAHELHARYLCMPFFMLFFSSLDAAADTNVVDGRTVESVDGNGELLQELLLRRECQIRLSGERSAWRGMGGDPGVCRD